MRAIRVGLLAAATAVPLILARPASADCPPENPACRLSPAQSVEVHDDPSWVRGTLDVVTEPGRLLTVPIPDLFVASVPLDAPAPAVSRLDVPLRMQNPSDVSCGVQALGMALAGLDAAAPTSDALLGFLQGNRMMYDFGTGVEELAYAAQSFGYRGSLAFHGWGLNDLQEQLEAGQPIVVALGVNGERSPGHFVTVTGISADEAWIAYSDPTYGEQTLPAAEFLAGWGLQGNSGVLVAEQLPSTPSGVPDLFPWVAFAAALMALVSTTPLVTWRQGIGGAADAGGASGGSTKSATKSSSSSKSSKSSGSSSSSQKSSKSSSKSKTKTSSVKNTTPATDPAEDLKNEMKDIKGISIPAASSPLDKGTGAGTDGQVKGSAAKPDSDSATALAQASAAQAIQELADPMVDVLLQKVQAPTGSQVVETGTSVPYVAGALDERLAKIEEVEALGALATAPLVMEDPVAEHWDLILGDAAAASDPSRGTDAWGGAVQPAYLLTGGRPPWVSFSDWICMTPEDQAGLEAAALELWSDLLCTVNASVRRLNQYTEAERALIDPWSWNETWQRMVDWETALVASTLAPIWELGPVGAETVAQGYIEWMHSVVIPCGAAQPASLPTAAELVEVYVKNSPGGELAKYFWVCSHTTEGKPVSWRVRSSPDLDGAVMENLGFMSVVEWSGEVVRGEDGLLWYSVSYLDAGGDLRQGWMADHDLDGMTGLAPYRPADEDWRFGDDEVPAPLDALAQTFGYGDGAAGWAAYSAGGSAAQFLDMQAIAAAIGLTGTYPAMHKNLCGQLAIFRALGVSLEEGFRVFSQIPACGGSGLSGLEILQQGETTWGDHLRATFEAFGWELNDEASSIVPREAGPDLQYLLSQDDAVIANVHSNGSGALVPNGSVEHWVQVTGARKTTRDDGTEIWEIDYLNSADNGGTQTLTGTKEQVASYFFDGVVVASSN